MPGCILTGRMDGIDGNDRIAPFDVNDPTGVKHVGGGTLTVVPRHL